MKKILMSMRVTEAMNYKEERNTIAFEYISFFESLGYMVILVPNNTLNADEYFNQDIDLLVLSGGNNVNPLLYKNEDKLNDVYNTRDNIEKQLLSISIKKNIKVLGICRGFHFINIFFKGTLTHNISNHVNVEHRLKSQYIDINNVQVNSFHNQGIKKQQLSKELLTIAYTDDEYIEACISKDKNILGIQWHPERQNKQFDIELINKFIEGKI